MKTLRKRRYRKYSQKGGMFSWFSNFSSLLGFNKNKPAAVANAVVEGEGEGEVEKPAAAVVERKGEEPVVEGKGERKAEAVVEVEKSADAVGGRRRRSRRHYKRTFKTRRRRRKRGGRN